MYTNNDLDNQNITQREWQFVIVGNIVKKHIDENGVERYGTKVYSSGTKVFLHSKIINDTVSVLGINRYGKYEICNIPCNLIENVRCKRVYKPKVLKIMTYTDLVDGIKWFNGNFNDRKVAKLFVKTWNEKYQNKNP